MDDAELGRREHTNLLETWGRVARRRGGYVADRGGLAIRLSGALMAHHNQILVADDPRAVSEGAFADAVALARSRPVPFMVHLRDRVDDAVRPLVEALGLVDRFHGGRVPGMGLAPLPAPAPLPPGLEIREATTTRERDTWLRVLADGFGMGRAYARDALGAAVRPDVSLILLTGYVGRRAVATGEGVLTGDTVGIYAITTLPLYRGLGYGAAMTRRLIELGAERGVRAAVLQASEMGQPVYEALGFRIVQRCAVYGDPDPDPA